MYIPDDGKIRIWLDAEYANSDRDDLLEVCDTEEEMQKFVEDWSTRQAERISRRDSENFEIVKKEFRKQLSYSGLDDVQKREAKKNVHQNIISFLSKDETVEKYYDECSFFDHRLSFVSLYASDLTNLIQECIKELDLNKDSFPEEEVPDQPIPDDYEDDSSEN